jgi:hypothetical protein
MHQLRKTGRRRATQGGGGSATPAAPEVPGTSKSSVVGSQIRGAAQHRRSRGWAPATTPPCTGTSCFWPSETALMLVSGAAFLFSGGLGSHSSGGPRIRFSGGLRTAFLAASLKNASHHMPRGLCRHPLASLHQDGAVLRSCHHLVPRLAYILRPCLAATAGRRCCCGE